MEVVFSKLIEAGFEARPGRIEDLQTGVPMFNLAEAEQTGGGSWTVERYTLEWQQNGLDLERSTRVVLAPGGGVVGCVELWDQQDPPARPWIWGRVHPDWKGRGIGRALLGWAFDTSRRALERLPADARLAPHASAPTQHTPSIRLFERMGMHVCRYSYEMLIELDAPVPEPELPEGIQIRTLRFPDDLEEVFQVTEAAFSEHFGYVPRPFETAFPLWKQNCFEVNALKPELWFLALDGERIAGTINAMEGFYLDADRGYIPTLGVLKPYRKRGVGQALLRKAFGELQRRGVPRASLGVDATNRTGAVQLYERVGMHVEHEFAEYEIVLRDGRELAVVE